MVKNSISFLQKIIFWFVSKVLIVFSIALSFASVLRVGYHSRYLFDDYCTAGIARKFNIFGALEYWYINWSGRYSFTLLITVVEKIGLSIVPYLPILLVLFWIFITWSVLNKVLTNFTIKSPAILSVVITFLLLFLVIFSIQIPESIYWQTGSLTYLAPILFWLLLTRIFLQILPFYCTYGVFRKFLVLFFIFIVTFLGAGFSEVSAVMQLFGLGLLLIPNVFLKRDKTSVINNQPVKAAFLATFVGLIIIILAPGNHVRQSTFLPHPDFFNLFSMTINFSLKFVVKWFIHNANIIWPVCIITMFMGFIQEFRQNDIGTNQPQNSSNKLFLVITLAIFSILVVSFLPSSWSIKREPPGRVLVLQIFVLVSYLLFISFHSGIYARSLIIEFRKNSLKFSLIFLLISIYFSSSVFLVQNRNALAPLSDAKIFSEKWDRRHELILSMVEEGKTDIYIELIGTNFMNIEHIQGDPNNPVNICAANFYGVEHIIAE